MMTASPNASSLAIARLEVRIGALEEAQSLAESAAAEAEAKLAVAVDDLRIAQARIGELEGENTRLAVDARTHAEDAADARQALVDLQASNAQWREVAQGRPRHRG